MVFYYIILFIRTLLHLFIYQFPFFKFAKQGLISLHAFFGVVLVLSLIYIFSKPLSASSFMCKC